MNHDLGFDTKASITFHKDLPFSTAFSFSATNCFGHKLQKNPTNSTVNNKSTSADAAVWLSPVA